LADELDVPLLGKIPLQEELRVGADEGRPLVLTDPTPGRAGDLPRRARADRADAAGAADDRPVAGAVRRAGAVAGTALPMAPAGGAKPPATQLPMA